MVKGDREREGATVLRPLWNHCNHGNGRCRDKAEGAGRRVSKTEVMRSHVALLASADRL